MDEKRIVYAFLPPPMLGSPVRKADGVVLSLSGKCWAAVLDLVVHASDGQTISKRALLEKLPRSVSSALPPQSTKKTHLAGDRFEWAGTTPTTYMTNTLAALRQDLRNQIDGPNDKATTLVRDNGLEIVLGFVVRPLLANDTSHYTFGRPT